MAETTPTIVTKNESVEVLNQDGKPVEHNQNLSAIFDKIESGQSADQAVKEVMSTHEQKGSVNEDALFPKPGEVVTDAPAKEPAKEEVKEEVKEEKPAETKAKEEKQEVVEEDVTDADLVVQPHDKPKTAKRIRALLTKIDTANSVQATTAKELKEKADKLAALEEELKKTKSADPVLTDEIKQQLADLKMYRRKYELERDPEVKQKFDIRLQQTEDNIYKMLADRGAGEGLLKIIKDEGGWAKFTRSARQIPMADGKLVSASDIAENIIDNLPYADRRELDAAVIEQVQTRRDRERFFQEEAAKAEQYFAAKDDEVKRQQEAAKQHQTEAQKLVADWENKLLTENDWMKEKTIPANATPEEKASIEEDNRHTRQIANLPKEYMKAKTVQDALNTITDAIRYHQERRVNAQLLQKVKAMEAKLQDFEKFKAAAQTTAKKGSIAGTGAPASERKEEKRPRTLEETLNMMEAGEAIE